MEDLGMQEFNVAHINEQGVDLIIVFLDQKVAGFSPAQLEEIAERLTVCARSVNWRGFVALVWPGGFWAQKNQHAFFASAPYNLLASQVNKTLTCQNL
jgi:hypothetical protein